MQPIYLQGWTDAPQAHLDTLSSAIALAESAASGSSPSGITYESISASRSCVEVASNEQASIYHAARAAVHAITAGYADITATAGYATSAAIDAVIATNHTATEAIRRDYELLRSQAEQGGWDNTTPVSAEVLGPIEA